MKSYYEKQIDYLKEVSQITKDYHTALLLGFKVKPIKKGFFEKLMNKLGWYREDDLDFY